MTVPIVPGRGSIGDAYIDVHANTSPFDRELSSSLDKAADDAEGELKKSGQKMGSDVSDGIDKELKRRGKTFAKSIEDGTKNTVIRVRSVLRFDRIKDAIRRRFRRDVGDSIAEEVSDAFNRAGRKGGLFSGFSQGIADAIGAGFNVSGRSPLIAILLPALLALVGVILAAVQAVNALVAVLFIIPGLIASIGLQVGVVAIAFQGMGEAIQGAFAAKNAKELREALKGLTPSARNFVRELLPLRKLFQDLQKTVQEKFFSQLTGVITSLRRALGPSLIKGFGSVAAAAGSFLADFGKLLASRGFVRFFNTLIPATVRWLDSFGHSLFGQRGFVTALIAMATALMPFMEKFGEIILRNLDHISGLIFQLASSPATQVWLDRMADTLQLVFDLLFKVGEFLFVFMRALDEQGGQQLIMSLIEALDLLMFVLASPAGQKAMEGLVNFAIFGIKSFTGLVIAILAVFAIFQVVAEWLKGVWAPEWARVLKNMGQAVVNAATFIGVWIARIVGFLRNVAVSIGNFFLGIAQSVVNGANRIRQKVDELIRRLRGIPGEIVGAFRNFGSLLINAGRALIQGLINGINQKIGTLRSVISTIAGLIAGFFGSSPAKEGPLSGQGWTKIRGQHMIQDLVEGIRSEIPNLRDTTMNATSNIVFGPNSVQVNVAGGTPDKNRAQAAGTAIGMSAANMIASRNTRLAVRTL
jgi:hypothetical protein